MIRLLASVLAGVAVMREPDNWRLLWRLMRRAVRELGRWAVCVAVLAVLWLMLAAAQAIVDLR